MFLVSIDKVLGFFLPYYFLWRSQEELIDKVFWKARGSLQGKVIYIPCIFWGAYGLWAGHRSCSVQWSWSGGGFVSREMWDKILKMKMSGNHQRKGAFTAFQLLERKLAPSYPDLTGFGSKGLREVDWLFIFWISLNFFQGDFINSPLNLAIRWRWSFVSSDHFTDVIAVWVTLKLSSFLFWCGNQLWHLKIHI